MRILTKELFAEMPMHRIGITQKKHPMGLTQGQQPLFSDSRDGAQQLVPSSHNQRIVHFYSRHVSHLITNLLYRGSAKFNIEKQVFRAMRTHIFSHLCSPYSFKSIDTAMPVKIDKHTSQVENNIFYSLQHTLIYTLLY